MRKNMLINLKKNIAKFMVSVLVMSSVSFVGNVKAHQNNLSIEQSVLLTTVDSFNQTTIELDQQEHEKAESLFFRDFNNKYFSLNISEKNLNFEDIKVLETHTKEGVFTSVTIPISGDEYNVFSNFTVIYDSSNKIISYVETVITKSIYNTFLITSYENGAFIRQDVTDVDYVSNEQLLEELDLLNSMSNLHTRNASCLALVLGIGVVTATVIYTLCGLSCAGLAIPVCVACIGAYATLGGASMSAVTNCFK